MQNKPNVILMFVDDMGYGDLSCFNESSRFHTENIDALAGSGVRMTDCHATSALCTPSRYGLLTGRYNWRSRLKSIVLPGGASPLIESGRMTLANLFKDNGYFTAAVGKWHLGLGWERKEIDGSEYGIAGEVQAKMQSPAPKDFILDGMDIDFTKPLKVSPNDFGFDYFFGTAASLDQPPYTYIENRQVVSVPDHITGVFPLDRSGASQQEQWQRGPAAPGFDFSRVIDDMHERALQVIDEHSEEPFFLYYPTHAVHGPLLPPKEYVGKSGINAYGDMVLYLDHLVGTITDKLLEKGIRENTIFILASDNGCSGVADYPLLERHGHHPSYVFRGEKGDIYDGGHRVPAIVSWPGHLDGGTACSQMVCLSDILATFAELFNTQLPDNAAEDSVSLIPALTRNESVRDTVVHSSGNGSFSIRTGDWKLELCRDSGNGMGVDPIEPTTTDEVPYQLYNMGSDVSETANVAAAHPDICLSLTKDLLDIIEKGRSTNGAPQDNAGMDSWKQLNDVRMLLEKMSK